MAEDITGGPDRDTSDQGPRVDLDDPEGLSAVYAEAVLDQPVELWQGGEHIGDLVYTDGGWVASIGIGLAEGGAEQPDARVAGRLTPEQQAAHNARWQMIHDHFV